MLMRLVLLTVVVILPAVSPGQTDSSRDGPPAATAGDLKLFTVAVIDSKTGKPVTGFFYIVG
jgi:hypothetical protein